MDQLKQHFEKGILAVAMLVMIGCMAVVTFLLGTSSVPTTGLRHAASLNKV